MVTIGVSPGYDLLFLPDADLAREFDEWVVLGATWLRIDVDWSAIEATEGTYDWSATDRVVDAATARGLKVLGLAAYCPGWATSDPGEAHAPPTDPADYAAFCGAAAARYAGRVQAWEIWNEPNISKFWTVGPDPGDYTALVQAAHPAIKTADPAAVVIAGALSPAVTAGGNIAPEDFTADCYTAGIQPYCDAWSVHPYCYPASPDDPSTSSWNTFQRLPLIRAAMTGDTGKPMWLTEWGAPTADSPGVTEAEQAAHHLAAVTMAAATGFGPLFLFSGRDRAEPDPGEYWTQYGVVRSDWSRKPAWRALRAVLPRTALQAASGGWRVEVRDETLAVTGPCDVWTSLTVILRHRRAGAWTLVLPAGHPQADLFTPGAGVLVWAPWSVDVPLLSGPLTTVAAATGDGSTPAMLTVTGIDDTGLLADRIVLPDPASAMDDQDTDATWTMTGPAEQIIRTLVDLNAGDSALTGRRLCDADPDHRLDTPTVLLGTARTVTARFDTLLTLLDQVAATDNLAVRVVQPGGQADRHLYVGATADRSGQVLLSQQTGTLTSGAATLGAPTATHVLVAGGGEGTDRALVERDDATLAADWSRRIEAFRDARDTTDTAELAQRGDETLAGAAATAGITVEPVDLPTQQFGTHYGLGDTVSVRVGDQTWTDVVTSVRVDITAAGGAVCKPSVGDPDTADQTTPAIYTRVRDLSRRLEALERRQ